MPTYRTSVRIRAPIDRVFKVFATPAEWARRLDKVRGVELLTTGAVGVGTRYRELRVLANGQEIAQEFEITEFVPGQSYSAVSTSAGVRFEFRASFAASDDTTTVTVMAVARGITGMTRLLLPIIWLFAGPGARASLEDDLGQLKRSIESEAAVTSS